MTKPEGDLFAKVNDSRLDSYRLAESLGMLPFYQPIEGEVGTTTLFEGRQMVMLGSNNYLGLSANPDVKKAVIDAVERYGTGMTGSRIMNGTMPLHAELEELLADWVGMEAAVVFTTGYAANLGVVSALVGSNDAVYVDSAAHASLVDGAQMADGALRAFRHNRPNSLRRGLRTWREQPDSGGLLVAVDGIYSMEGDWAPIPEIATLCREYGARFLVDEAHALGVAGPEGSGTARATGIRPDIIMSTFSKSLGSCGGFIAGSQDLIDWLRIACRPLMFTAAGTPGAVAAALAAARIARADDWRREAVLARAEQLRSGLRQLGYDVGTSEGSAIVPVHVGDMWDAGRLWRALLDQDVYTNCAMPPAVPRPVLRTSVMATHSEEEIDRALAGFEAARPVLGAGPPTDG